MPIAYWGSCLGDHGGHKSLVETSVVSCEDCSSITRVWGTNGEINIVVTFMEWCVTGPVISPLPGSLYVKYKLDNIYVTIHNVHVTNNNKLMFNNLSIELAQNFKV